jgi:uncharacterized protein (TIGR02284 family)
MIATRAAVHELIQMARDGMVFCQAAAGSVDNPVLRNVFRFSANAKSDLILALMGALETHADFPVLQDRLLHSLHDVYAQVCVAISERNDGVYLQKLDATECHFLRCFEGVMDDPSTAPGVSQVLHAHAKSLRDCYDEVRRLRASLAA